MGVPALRPRSRAAAARQLGRGAHRTIVAALADDPVGSCMVASRFEVAGMDRHRLGGSFWGVDGGRQALCFVGPNVTPLRGTPGSMSTVGTALGRLDRTCASIVGRAALTLPLWNRLASRWGPARDVRPDQPLLVCPDPPGIPSDEQVRPVGPDLLAAYFPAAVAMFIEEVGADPTAGDGGSGYRSRVAGLLSAGRAFARFDGSTVVYKAEIGALSSRVALIQGVWVHPDWRGQGLAAPATAAVVRHIQRLRRLPSLYVNAHNASARAAYARVGFDQAGTFASVLF